MTDRQDATGKTDTAASSHADPWDVVQVIDRLEVGPVRLEPDRLIAPYRVERGGEVAETELVYRYEEEVFDPADPTSQNLAALVGAQVALNYGLSAREIVLRGPFEDADRRFLEAMAEGTAREIYVKKFLEPNPFLTAEAAALPALKREKYLRSVLLFPDAGPRREDPGARWKTHPGRIAVLASGGKESLLSYALLKEIGLETHSIFINESGRHWYTALNAHRHLKAEEPQTTSRVWTTSDRVFSWMLRHLPFVRSDFAEVRSDQYPIRLWTVAVFLFGAIPVLRKRGIGRIVIGDEYDTTMRATRHGIPHYDGIYDQSRYFDDELSRYYRRKGWPLSQFSVVRPISELLVEKVLVSRYPDLQRHQVSCHATHTDKERVYPCGRCEKCRRVVGMLLAVGADPANCGYSPKRIESCLKALAVKRVRQETAAAEHLAFLLHGKGLLPGGASGIGRIRERPEIEQVRFHPEKSPPNWVPLDLRKPILKILLQYASGAVERRGRVWAPVDPFTSPEFLTPYPFDSAAAAGRGAAGGYLLAELTWPAAEARFKETDTALLPVGAIEQHGPHLPVDVDAWDADHLCRLVAAACSDPKPLVLPLIPYGVSYHHQDFAGTIGISPETLSRLVYDVGVAAARHGITKIIIVNGHGGNTPTLQLAAQLIHRDAHVFACVETGETSDEAIAPLITTKGDVHAGEIETSTTLATRPELVDMSKAESWVPSFSSQYLDFSSSQSIEWYTHTAKISPSGVMGDPTQASKEKGEKIWKLMASHLQAFVEKLKGMSLDEIYQRKL
jgi:creatinine amidohydrolase/Fe(II)-dependent formamide hydrolase-like protein